MTRFLALSLSAALAACASAALAAPDAPSILRTPVAAPVVPQAATAVDASRPAFAPPAAAPRAAAHKRVRRPGSRQATRVLAARHAATQEPRGDRYLNAVQVYPWLEGSLYRLLTAPEQVSDIALQPGEALVAVAAGDTVRWVIGDTTSGGGASRRVHVLVKPSVVGLSTNLLITTDRRVYHVELESDARAAMASISWTYPDDALLAVRAAETAAAAAQPVAQGLEVEKLNFGYAIEGDRPAWRPIRAFDDGRQVFIEFPPTLGAGEAPPLFVLGETGGAELVNYRLRGRYYVVDRLFAAAELRLGTKRQQIVRIVREGGAAQRRGKGKSS